MHAKQVSCLEFSRREANNLGFKVGFWCLRLFLIWNEIVESFSDIKTLGTLQEFSIKTSIKGQSRTLLLKKREKDIFIVMYVCLYPYHLANVQELSSFVLFLLVKKNFCTSLTNAMNISQYITSIANSAFNTWITCVHNSSCSDTI